MTTNPVNDSFAIPVSVSGTGDHLVYDVPDGKWLRVFRVLLTLTRPDPGTYGDVQFKSAGTALGGPLQLKDGAVITLELNQRRWLQTGVGENLMLNLGGDGRCTGTMTATLEDA